MSDTRVRDMDPVLALMTNWKNIDRRLNEIDNEIDAEQSAHFPKYSPRLRTEQKEAVAELLALERQIAETPAVTLDGIIGKLEVALLCYEHEDRAEMLSEHLLAVTASKICGV